MHVLLVDDDQEVCESVQTLLELEGLNVSYINDPVQLIAKIDELSPEVLLLDQNLSGHKGTDWLKTLRSHQVHKTLPVIMLTGVQGSEDKVQALDIGADDYVVKPFSPKELAARIRAVTRRVHPVKVGGGPTKLEDNGLVVDKSTYQITLNNNEIPVTLTEFKIVFELIKQKGEVLTRDQLRDVALGKASVTDRTIDVHLAALRKKLGPWADNIKTIRGVGYRYIAQR